jgi:hypothetical protein
MNWLLELVIMVWSIENGDNEFVRRSVHVDDVRCRFILVDSFLPQVSSEGDRESLVPGCGPGKELLYWLSIRDSCIVYVDTGK